jgi:hypothetical protein
LVTGETLQAITELAELCLDPTRTHTPISQAHVVADTSASEPISLLSVKNPIAINALAGSAPIPSLASRATALARRSRSAFPVRTTLVRPSAAGFSTGI